jgi:hypothetical protein
VPVETRAAGGERMNSLRPSAEPTVRSDEDYPRRPVVVESPEPPPDGFCIPLAIHPA